MTFVIDALAEAVISSLLGSVTNLLKENVQFILHAEDDLQELQSKLERLQKTLKDVDHKPFLSNQRDTDREGELKDVLYDAQDIIEKYRTKIELSKRWKRSNLRKKVQKLWRPIHSSFNENVSIPYWLGKKIKKVNGRLDKINIDKVIVDLGMLKTTPKEGGQGHVSGEYGNPRETTQYIGAQAPIGREDDKEKVKNLLLHGSMESGVPEKHGVSIISIVGQGGIGKTTLAKMVFGEVEQFGERRWWVCVSERPKREDLLKKILNEMPRASEKEPEDINSLSLNGLCTRLMSKLSKERFLLVLDDVWDLDWWHGDVEGNLMSGAMGSKILITTRNEDVSKGMNASYMHKVPKLTFEESWILFLKKASKEESELVSHNLKDIATNIVQKCGGLPLVVQTVGSLMRTKKMEKDDWESVEKSPIWKWEMDASSSSCEYGGILPGLILSYDDLPLSLKSCFVYCCIFPKDYEIEREKLIMQWVAHELVEENKGIDVEVTANQYVDDLIRRCLIEETEKGDLKLHDILHDLASYIGGKEYSQDFAIEHTRHVSLPSVVVEAMPRASRGKNKFRTLLSTHESYFQSPIVADLTNFKWLRVLSLEYCRIDELPQSIGYLSLLRYLDLSHSLVRKLPTSIGRLCNLQTMNLDYSRIEELPKEMGELCNLRHLGLEGTGRLEFIAEGLGKLSNLRTLKGRFPICDDRENTRGCKMRELRGLNKLKGELSIEGLGGSRKAIHHAPQLLKEKCGLISLKLDFSMQPGENDASASEQSDMLEALEPPRDLKKLRIYDYKGQTPAWALQPNHAMLRTLELEDCPLWVKVNTINSLERLRVDGCPTWCEIASMPLLKFLVVRRCDGLNTIGHMPALESFYVHDCDSLKLVVDDMPTLKSLTVSYSNGLKALANMPALESLEVEKCHGLEQVADMSTLKSLTVRNSNGLKTIANVRALESLEVHECDGLEQVAEDMPALKELTLIDLNTLKRLPACLPSLEELVVRNLPNWEGWPAVGLGEAITSSMPCLKEVSLEECPKMETLGLICALSKMAGQDCQTQLQQLKVFNCPSARLGWELLKQLPNLIKLQLDKAALDSPLPSPLPSEASTFLPSLKRLTLWDSYDNINWGRVPEWVWGISQLEDLELFGFTEEISLGGHWQSLQKLRRLSLWEFPRLKSVVDINIIPQQNDGVATPATDANEQIACLSRLEELQIWLCPSLDLPQELRNRLGERLRD